MKYFLLFGFIFLFSTINKAGAQTKKFSFASDLFISGNGHGGYASFELNYQYGKLNSIEAGPLIQLHSKKVNGFQFKAIHVLSSDIEEEWNNNERRFKAWLFTSLQAYRLAPLSPAIIAFELEVQNNELPGFTQPLFNTLEFNVGMGGTFRLMNRISLRTYIAIGFYDHLNMQLSMYHEKAAPVLLVGTGIQIN